MCRLATMCGPIVGRPVQVSTLSHVGGVAPTLLPTPLFHQSVEAITVSTTAVKYTFKANFK